MVAQFRAKETFQDQLTEYHDRVRTLDGQITAIASQVYRQFKTLSPTLLEGISLPSEGDAANLQKTVKTIERTLQRLTDNRDSIIDELQRIDSQLSR